MARLRIAIARWQGQVAQRLLAGCVVSAILCRSVPLIPLATWLFVYFVIHGASAWILTPQRIDRLHENRRLAWAALPCIALQAAYFGLIALLAASTGRTLGLALAIGVVAGGLTNNIVMAGNCKKMFIASMSPAPVYLCLLLPAVFYLHSHSLYDAVTLGISGALSVGMTVAIWKRYSQLLDLEEAAREQAQAANEAKSNFLATMSHEIRTPLNGVLGMARAMAADELSPMQRERLAVVEDSGAALLTILNDILDLSKVEAGKLEFEDVQFSLSALARSVQAAFSVVASTKGLDPWLDISNADGNYLGDPVRVRQILNNLVSNALKFTQAGEVGIVISRVAEGVRLEVSDTGVGLSPEAMSRLFQQFTQADASTARHFGGTGLGLSICRHLAEKMGGSIKVESQLGRGSRFTVLLKLRRAGDDEMMHTQECAARDQVQLGEKVRVLVADDNEVNRLVAKALLQQAGIEPCLVINGEAAVEAWKREDWDIILMDAQMPVMDGSAAARKIRALEAATRRRRTPILALSANAMPVHIAQYLAAGMDGHVAKPIDVSALFQAMEQVLYRDADAEDVALNATCAQA